jgi:hypothetical protein
MGENTKATANSSAGSSMPRGSPEASDSYETSITLG